MASVNSDTYGKSALPEDLWIEIFIRLSVKSLLRVKCVCKHWYGLIKTHNFEHKYLEYQKSMKQNRLLLHYFNFKNREFNYTILDEDAQSSNTYDSPEYLKITNESVDLDGPVNGLYCMYNTGGRCVLWNPALMEFKIVPLPPPHILPHYKVLSAIVGFGAGSLINDHKIVLVSDFVNLCKDHDMVYNELVVNLYNLRTNTWRPFDIGDLPLHAGSFINNISSSFVNGTYHWWIESGVVLAFDMESETFRMISGPDISQSDLASHRTNTIAVYDEHVALLSYHVGDDNYSLDIWVMLEEGIWFKQFLIGPFVEPMHPLEFWRKDRLLLIDLSISKTDLSNPNSGMVLYDLITQEIRNVGPRFFEWFVRACVYSESLISLDSENECDIRMVSDFLNRRSF